MTKKELLKEIAINSYNIGFGAKKHFASYDIIIKLPYWISFIVLSIGILQLAYDPFPYGKEVSVILILISIASLFLNFFNSTKDNYKNVGIELTKQFNSLRQIYLRIKNSKKEDFASEREEVNIIIEDFYNKSITKQVFLSQWYAHFKFFYEMQIDWIDEELNFTFWKDKFPNSLKIFLFIILAVIAALLFANFYI
jgi:hypothetical protein